MENLVTFMNLLYMIKKKQMYVSDHFKNCLNQNLCPFNFDNPDILSEKMVAFPA